jgi:HK97 family phage major capsid protein
MKKSNELLQERFKLTKDAEKVVIEVGDKEWTAEQRSKYDAIMKDVDALKTKADALSADEKRASAVTTALAEMEKPLHTGIVEDIGVEDRKLGPYDTKEYRKAFAGYLSATDAGTEYRAQQELRALQMDLDAAGGYTVVPQQFVAELIEAMKATTFFRGIAKTYTCANAESLGAPALDARPADPVWTVEIGTGDEDSTMKFGKRELHPHPLAKLLKVSKKLVRASALNVDQVVRDQLAYKLAIVEENAFLNGTGTGQPLGVFVNSPQGISSTYDVSTGNTTTAITPDGLIEAKYAMRPVYWNRAKWIFHYTAIKNLRKLRGNDGDFLWKAGLSSDRGDTLLDCPVLVSEFAPSTFTTGLYVGILGVFDYYYIADALDVTIQVLTELYAATNQNGYIVRKETDGMPVLGEAFVRVTLA